MSLLFIGNGSVVVLTFYKDERMLQVMTTPIAASYFGSSLRLISLAMTRFKQGFSGLACNVREFQQNVTRAEIFGGLFITNTPRNVMKV